MKVVLHVCLLAFTSVLFSSCVKTVQAPSQPVSNPLSGSWYLSDASENFGNGWYSFNAGIDGIFTFYDNGTAQYDDGLVFMQGNWYNHLITDGYYDEYGNYYTNPHEDLQVQVAGSNGTNISLYFDDISFAGNSQFTGTYYNGKSIERYTFSRY